MSKSSGSTAKVFSKFVKELEREKYRMTFCHFPLCFIWLNDFYTLIFWIIFNELEDNFVFACNFPCILSLFTDHFITQFFELFGISMWIVLILLS